MYSNSIPPILSIRLKRRWFIRRGNFPLHSQIGQLIFDGWIPVIVILNILWWLFMTSHQWLANISWYSIFIKKKTRFLSGLPIRQNFDWIITTYTIIGRNSTRTLSNQSQISSSCSAQMSQSAENIHFFVINITFSSKLSEKMAS